MHTYKDTQSTLNPSCFYTDIALTCYISTLFAFPSLPKSVTEELLSFYSGISSADANFPRSFLCLRLARAEREGLSTAFRISTFALFLAALRFKMR